MSTPARPQTRSPSADSRRLLTSSSVSLGLGTAPVPDTSVSVHAPLGTGLQTSQLLCWAERLERSGRPSLSPAQLTVDSAGSVAWTSL